jgi:hypothetical protein
VASRKLARETKNLCKNILRYSCGEWRFHLQAICGGSSLAISVAAVMDDGSVVFRRISSTMLEYELVAVKALLGAAMEELDS